MSIPARYLGVEFHVAFKGNKSTDASDELIGKLNDLLKESLSDGIDNYPELRHIFSSADEQHWDNGVEVRGSEKDSLLFKISFGTWYSGDERQAKIGVWLSQTMSSEKRLREILALLDNFASETSEVFATYDFAFIGKLDFSTEDYTSIDTRHVRSEVRSADEIVALYRKECRQYELLDCGEGVSTLETNTIDIKYYLESIYRKEDYSDKDWRRFEDLTKKGIFSTLSDKEKEELHRLSIWKTS